MKLLLSFLLVGLFLFQSCLNNYSSITPTNPSTTNKKSPQENAEDSIAHYIQNAFKNGKYVNVTFGDLVANKPKEIIRLDSLLDVKRKLPYEKDKYGKNLDQAIAANDSAIRIQKMEIHSNYIYHTFEINHLYKIIKNDSIVTLYETNFILYPNYSIKDLNIHLKLELNNEENELFDYFIMRYPLYDLADSDKSYRLNKITYENFFSTLDEEKKDKENLLKTILQITKYIRKHNNFDKTDFIQQSIASWIVNDLKVENYLPVKFSSIEEIKNENDETIGFKVFHLFTTGNENEPIEKVIYFELNNNLTLVGAVEVEAPFEKYFTE